MWLHTISDIKKVAACKVKPYELIDTENLKNSQDSLNQNKDKRVLKLEDGLSNVEDQISKDDETIQYIYFTSLHVHGDVLTLYSTWI